MRAGHWYSTISVLVSVLLILGGCASGTGDENQILTDENPEVPSLVTSVPMTVTPRQFDIEDGYMYFTLSSIVGLDIIKLW